MAKTRREVELFENMARPGDALVFCVRDEQVGSKIEQNQEVNKWD